MKATRKRTHFVPGVVFRTAFASVVPMCVAAACGGSTASSGGGGGAPDAGPDQFLLGVGCPAFECGVALSFADAAKDANERDAPIFTVACIGVDGGPCGIPPQDAAPGDGAAYDGSIHDAAGDAIHDATADVPIFAVAMKSFGDQ